MAGERLYVLNGEHPKKGPQQSLFTHDEHDLALHVARLWFKRGWKPYLFSKTYDGVFKVWFDWRKASKVPERKAA